jgi:hypothetical protein
MSIEFGMSTLYGLTNGIAVAIDPVITSGGVGSTAVVGSGYVWIDGMYAKISGGHDIDISAASPAIGWKYLYAYLPAGASSTAALGATGVTGWNPKENGYAVIARVKTTAAAGKLTGIDLSGLSATAIFGRANNCTVNISYDQAIARGGTLVFGNDMKMYNGSVEGTLEHCEIYAENFAKILGGDYASAGAASGTMSVSATQRPIPFCIQATQITNGVTGQVTILRAYSNQLSMKMDRENYTIPSVSFVGVANYEGDVIKYNL